MKFLPEQQLFPKWAFTFKHVRGEHPSGIPWKPATHILSLIPLALWHKACWLMQKQLFLAWVWRWSGREYRLSNTMWRKHERKKKAGAFLTWFQPCTRFWQGTSFNFMPLGSISSQLTEVWNWPTAGGTIPYVRILDSIQWRKKVDHKHSLFCAFLTLVGMDQLY